jgi:hypothetical protein
VGRPVAASALQAHRASGAAPSPRPSETTKSSPTVVQFGESPTNKEMAHRTPSRPPAPTNPQPVEVLDCWISGDPDCFNDPLSVRKLRRLIREQPEWHLELEQCRPPRPGLGPDATVEQLFRSGLVDRLWAANAGEGARVYADRGAARRLVELFGERRAASLGETDLRALMNGTVGRWLAPRTRLRDAGLLRSALLRFAAHTKRDPGVAERARPRPGRTNSPPLAPRSEDILAVLAVAPSGLRRAIALALGAGATRAELARCTRAHVLPFRGHVPYVLLGTPERLRPVALPPWAFDQLTAGAGRAFWAQGSEPVVGGSPDALERQLRAACRRADCRAGSVTFGRLRSAWQAAVATSDAPRAVVRGRWAVPPSDRRRPSRSWSEQKQALYAPSLALARGWAILSEPPGGWPERTLRKPSGRTRPWQPEADSSGRHPPLPASVR